MTTDQLIKILEITTPLLRDLLLLSVGGFSAWGMVKFWYKKEKRFFKNIQQPFAIFRLSQNPSDMELEMEMLRSNGLFTIPKMVSDPRNLDWLSKQRLLVITVDEKTSEEDFKMVYERARDAGTPVIIYTLGKNNIALCDAPIVQTYSKRVIANHPLRLLSDIFTILSTLPAND